MPTNYAGETYRIQTSNETDFDGVPLDPDEVTSVEVQVFPSDFSAAILDEIMDYDTELGHWTYLWDTTGVDAGTYKAMVKILFADSTYSLEGPIKIRLKRDPRP